MSEKIVRALKPIAAMVCISVVEVFAIMNGINGALLSIIVASLAGLGGYSLGRKTS